MGSFNVVYFGFVEFISVSCESLGLVFVYIKFFLEIVLRLVWSEKVVVF